MTYKFHLLQTRTPLKKMVRSLRLFPINVCFVKLFLQSEERGKEEYASCEKPQDIRIAKSAGNSLDKLAGSSVDPDGKTS